MVEFARLLGLRFSHDKGCPAERFETLREPSATRSNASRSTRRPAIRLASRSRDPSVLTVDLVDQAGSLDPAPEPNRRMNPYPTVEEAG